MSQGPISRILGTLILGVSLMGCGSAHIKKAELGYDAYFSGDLEQAEADFQSSLSKVEKYEPALTGLGFIAYDTGEFEQAKAYFDKAIEAEPTAEAYWGRGKTQLRLYKWQDANRDLKGASGAGMVEANLEWGVGLMLVGDGLGSLDAIETFATATDLEPERGMQAVNTAYRVGLKNGLTKQALQVVSQFSFDEETLFAEEHSRILIDLAYHSADYSQAMREARRAPDSLSFGLVIRELSPVAKRSFEGVGGAVVDSVHVGSPAHLAGLRAGDILTGIEAVPVVSAAQFAEVLADLRGRSERQSHAIVEVLRGETYIAAFMNMGEFRFEQAIRTARDEGLPVSPAVASDDLAQWP